MNINISEKSNFIWKIADLLRGDYKQSEYGDVILPFTVLCRLDRRQDSEEAQGNECGNCA